MGSILRNFAVNWRAYPELGILKRFPKAALRSIGLDIVQTANLASSDAGIISDLSKEEQKIVGAVKPFTMSSVERVATLLNAVGYISTNNIPGNIAECGVWRGGSMMTVALALLSRGDTSRNLYLYDTFEGMSAPTAKDTLADGTTAAALMSRDTRGTGVWCYASLEDVQENLLSTGYPKDKIHFVKGKVEDTIPKTMPGSLALLRLDTDWYESTKHELTHLFPLLDQRGVLILDDYGNWQGCRMAVDEYWREHKLNLYLHRIDATGRMVVGKGN